MKPLKGKTNWYLCNKCSGIIERESNAKRIKSDCVEMGNKPSILTRIDSDYRLAEILRKRFLKNILQLDSFSKREKTFLYLAWQQGAMVVFNRIVRKPYKVPAEWGIIVEDQGNYIGVLFDDKKPGQVETCHPTYALTYTEEIEWPRTMTKAQQRYRKYLEVSDCFDSFKDFLRSPSAKEPY